MYKKKDKKVMMIAAAVVIVIVALLYILPGIRSNGPVEEVETEEREYEVLIHKTDAGKIDMKKSWLKSDGETETKLSVKPGTLVSLNVTPKENKTLEGVRVVEAADFNNEINTIINETRENTFTVDFSMPESDVIMSFQYETKEVEEPEATETPTPTPEESAEDEKNPYGLTVHGITADLITSFNGHFDDREFCQQLGDTLHLDSPRSEYFGVTDVTFSRDPYLGEQDNDKVYHYIYFGEDPDWKMLATYYLKDQSYVFTKYEEPEVPDVDPGITTEETGNYGYSTGGYSVTSAAGTSGGSYSVTTPGISTSISFDIMRVSKVFLDFTGDPDAFYQKAFEYVLSKGLSGSITGTMSGYEIDAESQTATITIKLNNGNEFTGSFDKQKKEYSFTGL